MIPFAKLLEINGCVSGRGAGASVAATFDSGTSEGAKKGWMKRRFGGGSLFDRSKMSADERAAWESLDADLKDAEKDSVKTAFDLIDINGDAAQTLLDDFHRKVKESYTAVEPTARAYIEQAQTMKHDIGEYIKMARKGGAKDSEIFSKAQVALHSVRRLEEEAYAQLRKLRDTQMTRYKKPVADDTAV